MTQSQLLMVSAGFVLLMGAMLLIGFGRRRPVVSIDQRLAHFADRPMSLHDEELAQPFSQRVLRPILKSIILRLGAISPASNTDKIKLKLAEAGNPSGLGVAEFVGLRLFLALALGVGFFLLFSVGGNISAMSVVLPLCLAAFGFMMPGIWLSRKAKARRKEILKTLPDAIDLLTISVESGLGFDPALMRVAEKWDNAVTREFARVLSEMRIGKSKRESLREMSARCNVDDLTTFVSAIIQADQLGVSISQVLRIQSEAMRVRRRQRAEEQAHKAPIKMLFPMAFLIFPALYVIILGPSVPQIVEAFK
jgi:tight adherence protein C